MSKSTTLPRGMIISPRKERALCYAKNHLGKLVAFGELELELGLTPNQRQRDFCSLKRDNLLTYIIIRDKGYFFKSLSVDQETCPNFLSCPYFSGSCSKSCDVPLLVANDRGKV